VSGSGAYDYGQTVDLSATANAGYRLVNWTEDGQEVITIIGRGYYWWQETSIIEAPDGIHIFRDRERLRLFTYWDIVHYLQSAGFKEVKCYPDWKTNPSKKPKAETLIFVSRKD
jgi:hypothetical protein